MAEHFNILNNTIDKWRQNIFINMCSSECSGYSQFFSDTCWNIFSFFYNYFIIHLVNRMSVSRTSGWARCRPWSWAWRRWSTSGNKPVVGDRFLSAPSPLFGGKFLANLSVRELLIKADGLVRVPADWRAAAQVRAVPGRARRASPRQQPEGWRGAGQGEETGNITWHDIIWHHMTSYDITWHLTSQDIIWHHMTSDITWHLT